MKRKTSQNPADSGRDDSLAAADGAAGESRAVGRRRLLSGGGAVVAGAVGAGVAMAASAAPASAATGDAVLQGTSNSVGTDQPATEITADNSASTPTPTLVLTNTGSDTTNGYASPPLRLTKAASGLLSPAANTAGGDLVATYDGNLWFTHDVPNLAVFPAVVHTDANSNSFVPLSGPNRVLDTRSSAGRTNVLDPSGNLDSQGRLIGGKTIHVDLSSLVYYGDAMMANLTVMYPATNGWVLLWSGSTPMPTAASIVFSKGQAISNLVVSGIESFSSSTDTVAIHAATTTHVILDVTGFYVADFAQVIGPSALSTRTASRAQHASKSAMKAFTKR